MGDLESVPVRSPGERTGTAGRGRPTAGLVRVNYPAWRRHERN
jgi:hypothetical protein